MTTEAVAQEGRALTCFGCRYDLWGQPSDGMCPECGATVASSVREDRWDWAEGRWARRVRWGAAGGACEYMVLLVGALGQVQAQYGIVAVYGVMGLCTTASGFLIASRERRLRRDVAAVAIKVLTVCTAAGYITMLGLMVRGGMIERSDMALAAFMGMAVANGAKQFVQLWRLRGFVKRIPGRRVGWVSAAFTAAPVLGWWGCVVLVRVLPVLRWPWNVVLVLAAIAGLIATAVYDVVRWRQLRRA